MALPTRTPLAWRDLVHDRQRLAVSLLGVCFAVFIMFVQTGFLNGIYDSQTDLVSRLDADLVMINRVKEDFLPTQPFPRRRLVQALGVDGVSAAYPVYVEELASAWKDLEAGTENRITTIGFNPAHPVWLLPEIADHLPALAYPGTALADERSRDLYGELVAGSRGELSRRAIRIVGSFRLGPDFRSDSTLIMTDRNFFRYFPDPRTGLADPERVEIGLLHLTAGAEPGRVRDALGAALPGDVVVLTKPELAARIEGFWREFQPIGAVFGLGAFLGFVIGVVIVYQILFTDITDHVAQLATLKAIGYVDRSLTRIVLEKALLLAGSGFLAGLLLSGMLYSMLEAATGIRMWLTPGRTAVVLLMTVSMCMAAALIAARKVRRVDPADLF